MVLVGSMWFWFVLTGSGLAVGGSIVVLGLSGLESRWFSEVLARFPASTYILYIFFPPISPTPSICCCSSPPLSHFTVQSIVWPVLHKPKTEQSGQVR